MNSISITLNTNEKEKVITKLHNYAVVNNNKNIIEYCYKFLDHKLTLYKTNVLVIQGKNADIVYEKIFNKPYTSSDYNKIDIFKDNKVINQNHVSTIGCDEVGVGDFFGGICACAVYVSKDIVGWLKSIGVADSKKLSDEKIYQIYNQIKDKVVYVAYNINAIEYNRLFNDLKNSHVIKTVLHNQCLWDLSKKVHRPYFVIMDQYVSKDKYNSYLEDINIVPFKIDVFTPKAESQYLAVACASIIARVLFLDEHRKMCSTYNVNIPLGSSNDNIKNIARYIINNFGENSLRTICKNHFKTYDEIKEN